MRQGSVVGVSSLEKHWVSAVNVGIDLIARICCVECDVQIIVQAEVGNVFSEAVYVVVGHHGSDDFQELVLKDYDGAIGREEDFFRARAGNLELKAGCIGPCQ